MEKKEIDIPDFLVKLVEGCSTYNKVSTNFWLAIALFSIISLSPTKTDTGTIKMPFDLGEFSQTDFYPLTFLIISLLIICFGSTFSQAMRTRKLIQRTIDDIKDEQIFKGNIYLQDIIDAIIHPSLNRVAPLAQILQGENQFFPEALKRSRNQKIRLSVYYILLKSITWIVLYFFPAYSLIISFSRSNLFKDVTWHIPPFFFYIVGLFAIFILSQLFISDILFAKNVIRKGIFKRI